MFARIRSRLRFRYIVVGCLMLTPYVILHWNQNGDGANESTFYGPQQPTNEVKSQRAKFLDIFPLFRKEENEISVLIVEEHHEVIPYWLGAAENGKIPRSNNILLHVDGHSDMGTPHSFPGFPFFTWPRNQSDMQFLMQRNDVFIQTAFMTGLLGKVVWIYPSFILDLPNHLILESRMGWIDRNGRRQICYCEKDKYEIVEKSTEECSVTEIEAGGFKTRDVEPVHCNTLRRFEFEIINEEIASELAFKRNESILLDIDEDFFGNEFAFHPLLNSNINPEILEKIDDALSKLFCPKDITSTSKLDETLVFVLDRLQDPISCRRMFVNCMNDMRTAEAKLVMKHKMHEWLNATCNISGIEAGKLIDKLLEYFSSLNSQQLGALKKVGFCWNTTPKGYQLLNPTRFQICQGLLLPENDLVQKHETNLTDIQHRTENLDKILSSLTLTPPALVTVARSIRDGYTPRRFFKRIEGDIIRVLNRSFRNINITYDADLQGGRPGWRYDDLANFVPY